MAALSESRIAVLLEAYAGRVATPLLSQISAYLDLLLKWNAFTNLTAVRDPEQIVRTHFGESLFAASKLPEGRTLLDFGSGAGFPGLPIQLARPDLRVTLAESQGKKAAFLREVVRAFGLGSDVWPRRVELMPPERRFDMVCLRAVDDMLRAFPAARQRVDDGGTLLHLSSNPEVNGAERIEVPGGEGRLLLLYRS